MRHFARTHARTHGAPLTWILVLSQNILFSVDSSLLDTISEFVAASGRRRAPSGQHGGDDDLDLLLEQLAKPAKLEIPTALLFVGGAL